MSATLEETRQRLRTSLETSDRHEFCLKFYLQYVWHRFHIKDTDFTELERDKLNGLQATLLAEFDISDTHSDNELESNTCKNTETFDNIMLEVKTRQNQETAAAHVGGTGGTDGSTSVAVQHSNTWSDNEDEDSLKEHYVTMTDQLKKHHDNETKKLITAMKDMQSKQEEMKTKIQRAEERDEEHQQAMQILQNNHVLIDQQFTQADVDHAVATALAAAHQNQNNVGRNVNGGGVNGGDVNGGDININVAGGVDGLDDANANIGGGEDDYNDANINVDGGADDLDAASLIQNVARMWSKVRAFQVTRAATITIQRIIRGYGRFTLLLFSFSVISVCRSALPLDVKLTTYNFLSLFSHTKF